MKLNCSIKMTPITNRNQRSIDCIFRWQSVLWFFVLCLSRHVFANEPIIVPFNVPNELVTGAKVKLMCSVSKGSHPFQFRWMLNGIVVREDEDLFLQQLDDANILNIRQLQAKHNGNYTCQVTNQFGSASHTASLYVNAPPQWTQRPESSGEYQQGSFVRVPCSASGHPKPKIRWQKVSRTGEKLDWPSEAGDTNADGTLTFVSVKREHEGDYICTASNILKDLVAKFTLLVKVPATVEAIDDQGNPLPKPSTSTPLVRQGRRGEPLSVRCRAFGDGPLNISWTRQGQRNQPLRPGTNGIDILSTGQNDGSLSELHFRSLDRQSAGEYVCQAKNQLGSSQIHQQVLVLEQPDPPSELRVSDVDATSAKLTWKLPFDGNSPITKLFLYYWQNNANSLYGNHRLHRIELSSTTSTWHMLNQLSSGVSYSAAVSAVNVLGESALSTAVRFSTRTRAPTASPTDLSIGHRLHNQITLHWRYPLQERLNGNLSDFQIYYRPVGEPNFFIERFQLRPEHYAMEAETSSTFSIRLHNLRRATDYEIKVRAFNRDGYGPDSELLQCRTLSGPLPSSPKISYHQIVSRAYLILRWEHPSDFRPTPSNPTSSTESGGQMDSSTGGDELRYFMVYVERADNRMYSQQVPAAPSQRQITITNLEQETPYNIYVTAANANGESPLSEPLIINIRPYPIEMSLFMAEKNILAVTAIMIGLFAILIAIVTSLLYMRHFQTVHRKKMQQLSTQTLSKCGTTKSTATYATIGAMSMVGAAPSTSTGYSAMAAGSSGSNVIPVMVGYTPNMAAAQGAFYGGNYSPPVSSDYDTCKPTTSSSAAGMMAGMSSKSVHHSPQLGSSFGHVSIRSTESPITIDFEQQLKIKEKLCQSNKSLNVRNYDECIYDDALE